MVSIKVFDSIRMAAIEAKAIVSGSVNAAGDLTLKAKDGTTVAAGNVKGPPGNAGTPATGLSAYPVGAVYISVTSTSPATLFGGTWTAIAKGQALMGFDSSQTEFNAAEKAGGTKTVTISIDQMPAHDHGVSDLPLLTYVTNGGNVATTSGSNTRGIYVTRSGSTGGGSPTSILSPYLTVYMWKRTA